MMLYRNLIGHNNTYYLQLQQYVRYAQLQTFQTVSMETCTCTPLSLHDNVSKRKFMSDICRMYCPRFGCVYELHAASFTASHSQLIIRSMTSLTHFSYLEGWSGEPGNRAQLHAMCVCVCVYVCV